MRAALRIAIVVLVSGLAVGSFTARAHAQPADAAGKPRQVDDLASGTVQVKVIAGSMAKPVADVDVHMFVGDVDHTLRTNAEGHASLPGVAAGQPVRVTVAGDKGEISSETFQMPDGAVKLFLTTAPMEATPGPGAGPMAGGAMDPRAASGKGRSDQSVEAGTLIATVTYDEVPPKSPPVGTPVVCVGYSDDHGVTAQVAKVDKDGHATFKGLDTTGATAYFVMTRLSRGPDAANLIVDRLQTTPPLELGATAGWKVMLSSETRDSDKPAIDDLSGIEAKADVPAGKVLISVVGVPEKGATARLVDAITGKVVTTAPLVAAPTQIIQQNSPLQPHGELDTGTLGVQLVRALPPKGDGIPMPATKVTIKAGDAVVSEASTGKDGYAQLDSLPAGKQLTVEVTIAGQVEHTDAFTLPAKGGAQITMAFEWDDFAHMTAVVDAPDGPTATYYAETKQHVGKNGAKTFRSEPFQPAAGHGTVVSIVVYPRAFLSFRLNATAEDDYLAIGGEMSVRNYSWSPLVGGPDGLQIPLPEGFTGAGVAEEQEVAKDEEGFRVLHPIPPFGMTFRMGFSLPIHGQHVDWDMPVPIGVYDAYIQVRKWPPDVTVHPPTGMQALRTGDGDDHGRKYFVMDGMVLMPLTEGPVPLHLQFSIDNLPSAPMWKVYAPKIVGLLVVVMVLIAASIAIGAAVRAGRSRASQAAGRRARIDALYEQLVAIQQTGAGEARREEIMGELEELLAAERAKA